MDEKGSIPHNGEHDIRPTARPNVFAGFQTITPPTWSSERASRSGHNLSDYSVGAQMCQESVRSKAIAFVIDCGTLLALSLLRRNNVLAKISSCALVGLEGMLWM
jgi:hypothetical protein